MKIESVLFENFIAIETGMGKRKLHIDLTKCENQIMLLVGPMGSGKTTILSHLIPYAHVGTLDERNSNPIIISGENGKKEIVYNDDGDIYRIVHKYTWTKDHHAVKSFIEKNGVELNENGNQNSFREIVEAELGFSADLTRLLRLGPNVANVIDMPTIERKEYIARRQTDVETYLTIHKDMKERARGLTAQSQLIARKLNGVSEDDIAIMRGRNEELANQLKLAEARVAATNDELSSLRTESEIYLEGKTVTEYEARMDYLRTLISSLTDKITSKQFEIDLLLEQYGTLDNINRELGKADADIQNNNALISSLNMDNQQQEKRRIELEHLLQTSANDDYIAQLQTEYKKYLEEIESLRVDIEGFECEYNSEEINTIIGQLRVMDSELNAVVIENPDVVHALLKGNSEMVSGARHQIDMIQGKIYKLQRSAANIKYVDSYDVSDELALPKECKIFSTCPFFYTHPNTIKSTTDKNEMRTKITKIQNEIDYLNSRIDELSSYPVVWNRIEQCRKIFNGVANKLRNIGALSITSVDKILSKNTSRIWYDNDVIIDTLEKCVKREKLAIAEVKSIELRRSLDSTLDVSVEKIQAEYKAVIEQIRSNKEAIRNIEEANKSIAEYQATLNRSYDCLKNINKIKDEIQTSIRDIENAQLELKKLDDRHGIVLSNKDRIKSLEDTLTILQGEVRAIDGELTAGIIKLNTVIDYQREFADIANELKILNLIIKASSPKNGIPLIYVQSFLNDCVDDINDMLANVLPDVEVCEFVINDKEFRIPYSKGGRIIDDVVSASQGERAIISIALSFALMMKSSSKYNIPLLDEVDGPIHNVSRRSLLLIFSQYFKKINAEQAFFITHNDIFEGYPVDIITTSADEHLINRHGKIIVLS